MAYQLLGDILFRNNLTTLTNKVIKEFDLKIGDWSYEIIYNKLTNTEHKIFSLIANGITSNQEIMNKLNMSKGSLAIYKKRLSQEGILNTNTRGKSDFLLPRFDYFIRLKDLIANC